MENMPKKRGPGRPTKVSQMLDAAGLDVDELEQRYAVKISQGGKLTPQLVVKLLEAGAKGESIAEFCVKNGLSRKSFYKYVETDEAFADAVEQYKLNFTAYYTRLARLAAIEGSGVSVSGLNTALKFALGFGLKETHTLATGEEIDITPAVTAQGNAPVMISLNLGGLNLPQKTKLTFDKGDEHENDRIKQITYEGESARVDS